MGTRGRKHNKQSVTVTHAKLHTNMTDVKHCKSIVFCLLGFVIALTCVHMCAKIPGIYSTVTELNHH